MYLFETIDRFKNEYEFLSNFYPCKVEYEGIVYPSSEHAYVAAKTDDVDEKIKISKIYTPGKVKQYGRSIELDTKEWDAKKIAVMKEILEIKFSDAVLARKLVETYPCELIEGNWWGDMFWGVHNGVGRNYLGSLLMHIRSEIRFKQL